MSASAPFTTAAASSSRTRSIASTSPISAIAPPDDKNYELIVRQQRQPASLATGIVSSQHASGVAPIGQRRWAEDPGPAVWRSSGHGPGRRPLPHTARGHWHHQQGPARLDDRPARRP